MKRLRSRRKFLKQAAGISVACSGIGTLSLLESCVTIRYADFSRAGNNLVVSKQEFEESEFVLLSSEEFKAPIYLLKYDDNYLAVYLMCTHKACDVQPAGSILACPCHGSQFTRGGKVLQGPARENLMAFPVSDDDKNVYIQISA